MKNKLHFICLVFGLGFSSPAWAANLTVDCAFGLAQLVSKASFPIGFPGARLDAEASLLASKFSISAGNEHVSVLGNLEQILVRYSSDSSRILDESMLGEFRNSVDQLVAGSGAGFRIQWPKNISATVEELNASGPYTGRLRGSYNPLYPILQYHLYGALVESDRFPVSEPHDLLNHLPFFLAVPEAWPVLKRRFQLFRKLDELLGSERSARGVKKFKDGIRWMTHEDIPVRFGNGGDATLICFGGAAYELALNAHLNFAADDRSTFSAWAAAYLHPARLSPVREPRQYSAIFANLPDWAKFETSHPKSMEPYLEALRDRRLLSDEQADEFWAQLAKHLEPVVTADANPEASFTTHDRAVFFEKVFKRAATFPDPVVFSKEAHLTLYTRSLDLLEKYLNWLESARRISGPIGSGHPSGSTP